MGNSSSLDVLRIKLDCDDGATDELEEDELEPVYVAGQTVRGYVTIDLGTIRDKYPGKALNFQLVLQIIGTERGKIVQGRVARRAERILLFNETLLECFTPEKLQNQWTADWHDCSFCFKIPDQMPSSLRCDTGGRSYAELRYKIKAQLEQTASKGSGNLRRQVQSSSQHSLGGGQAVIQERRISIKAKPLPPLVIPFMVEPTSHEIKTFGLKSRGRIIFGVSARDTHLGPGETLELVFACRNHSVVDIQQIRLKLVETVIWKMDDLKLSKTVERTLLTQEETLVIPQKSMEQIWYERAIESDIDEFQDSFGPIHHELHARHNVFRIQMPEGTDAHDTYAGPLVRCKHHLELKVKTEDHVDDPKVLIPIVLKQFVSLKDHKRQSFKQKSTFDYPGSMSSTENEGEPELAFIPPAYMRTTQEEEEEDTEGATERSLDSIEIWPPRNSINRRMPSVKDFFPDDDEVSGHDTEGENPHRTGGPRENIPAPVEVPLSNMILGGRVRPYDHSGSWTSASDAEMSWAVQDSSTSSAASFPCYERLLDEMLVSVDDLDIVRQKLDDPEWQPLLVSLSADEFGLMIGHVNVEHDQPKVAVAVASAMFASTGEGVIFTCEHAISAVQMAADWTRISMVQRLLPFCSDLVESRKRLTDILTPWELTVLHSDLEQAILERGGTWE